MVCPVSCRARSLLAAALAIASVMVSPYAHAQIPGQEANSCAKSDRPYNDGPLTAADFRGQPPTAGELAGSPFQAFLYMDLTWSSEYRTAGRGRVITAYLTQFQAAAVSNPSKSWNLWGKKKPDLLDHEQGHFDITQTHAQRLEIRMRKLLAAKQPLAATGETKAAAVEALNALLDKEVKTAKAVSDEENHEYDRLTVHGGVLEKQNEFRHVHQETLKKLAAELKAVKKKG